jgi:poly(3-hydroxybutyrate) depolymerase
MYTLLLSIVLATIVVADNAPLPSNLPINPDTITVSGISSGGAMAIQIHVAFSSIIKGVGAIASPPYYCAQGQLSSAMMCMYSPLVVNLDQLVSTAKSYEIAGKIDPLSNLAKQNAYIFSGTKDTIVAPGSVQKAIQFYEKFNTDMKVVTNIPAQHAWITDNTKDSACGYLGTPFINNCNRDVAGEILHTVLFDKVTPKPRQASKKENLFKFDQSSYGSSSQGLYSWGNIYIPTACQVHKNMTNDQCHLHISFHGCEQNFDYIGERFTAGSGLNEWAESNNIVVLYPQASKISFLTNPNACWDWWGYTNADYANKDGVQMKAIKAMISTLLGH